MIRGINSPADVATASPDSYRFHSTFKSLVRMVLAKVHTPQTWLDDMTGNMAVIRDIYYDYLQHEKQTVRNDTNLRGQQDRKTVISSAVPFTLAVSYYDSNFAEVADWFLYRICRAHEAGLFQFNPAHIYPECWFQDGRGRTVPTEPEMIDFFNWQKQRGKV